MAPRKDPALRITGPDCDGQYWLHAIAPSGISAGWALAGKGTPVGDRVLAELSTILADSGCDNVLPLFDAMGLPPAPPFPTPKKA